MALNIIKKYLTKSSCYNSGGRINPEGIQIHTLGTPQNTAESLASYWNQAGIQACVHYAVDAEVEGKVLQFLPENYRSWADAGYGNGHLITIEGMESDYMKYTSGANFTITNVEKFKADIKRSYNGMVLLCADICKRRGWNPLAKLKNGLYLISSHNEGRLAGLSSGHVDPTHVWSKLGYTMDGFRGAVKAAMEPQIKVGGKYKLLVNIYFRKTPSGEYVKWKELSESAKKKSTKKSKSKLKKGNTVQALEVKTQSNGNVWIRIKNGWLCVKYKGKYRVK